MTPQEFRAAFLEAQNGLGNSLQNLIMLSERINELTTRYNELSTQVQSNYERMNAVVEQYLKSQENE